MVGKLAKLSPSPSSQFDLSQNCRHQPGIVTFGSEARDQLDHIRAVFELAGARKQLLTLWGEQVNKISAIHASKTSTRLD